jgi:hypothetical protein
LTPNRGPGNNPGAACRRPECCVFCKGIADAVIHAEPNAAYSQNLLLQLDCEWLEDYPNREPDNPKSVVKLLASLLASRKDLRKQLSYYGFVSLDFPKILEIAEANQLGRITIELRRDTVQESPQDEPVMHMALRGWIDFGNSYYASWFKQTVAPFLPVPIHLNEEHTADIVEAILAIEMLKERDGFRTPTRTDKFVNFYAGFVGEIEGWVPASCLQLASQLPATSATSPQLVNALPIPPPPPIAPLAAGPRQGQWPTEDSSNAGGLAGQRLQTSSGSAGSAGPIPISASLCNKR